MNRAKYPQSAPKTPLCWEISTVWLHFKGSQILKQKASVSWPRKGGFIGKNKVFMFSTTLSGLVTESNRTVRTGCRALVLIQIYLFLTNSSHQFSTATPKKPKSSPPNWKWAEDPPAGRTLHQGWHHSLFQIQRQQNNLGVSSTATVKYHGINQDWVFFDFKWCPVSCRRWRANPWEQLSVQLLPGPAPLKVQTLTA